MKPGGDPPFLPLSPTTQTLPPAGLGAGLRLKDRYRVGKELGRGGFAVVYLAHDEQLHSKPVVVKVLLEQVQQGGWSRKKFAHEREALARIDHPGVVGVLDAGETPDGRQFLILQYVDGVTLRSVIGKGGMRLDRVARIVRQIGQALTAAHERGVFHRDLKPANIMLQDLGGGEELVKIIDFGIATVRDPQASMSAELTEVAGSVLYMAPEQLLGKPTAASDLYSLGVIAYEMVTGRLPFNPESPFQLLPMQQEGVKVKPVGLRPELPLAAQDTILKALSYEPRNRPRRARDFGEELAAALRTGCRVSMRAGDSTTAGGEPNLGPLVSKMCDRRPQEDDFRGFFLSGLRERPGAPQVFIIHGEEGECHESLVERLIYQAERLALARPGEHSGAVNFKKIPWQYEGALEPRRNRLLWWLFEQCVPSRTPAPSELTMSAFDQLVSQSLCALIVIQHDIRTACWDRLTRPLIESYLEFWAGLKDDPSRPQLLVFLNVVYPAAVGKWGKVWLERMARKHVEAELRAVCQPGYACWMLSELRPITREDVLEWFSLHNIYDSEELRLKASESMFRARGQICSWKPMAEIEARLRELHSNFVMQRGYI